MAEGISLNIIKIIEKGILEHRKEEKTQHPKKKWVHTIGFLFLSFLNYVETKLLTLSYVVLKVCRENN